MVPCYINGQQVVITQTPCTLHAVFDQLQLETAGRIVEINGVIIERAREYDTVAIAAHDVIEIIQFMGGGSLSDEKRVGAWRFS